MTANTARDFSVVSCNMSFRRTVFETIGGFRHEIGRMGTRPVGDEETDSILATCPLVSESWLYNRKRMRS